MGDITNMVVRLPGCNPDKMAWSQFPPPEWDMLERGTERNQRGIFRKMLKRGTSTFKLTMDKYRINIFFLSDIVIYIQGYKHILRTIS